MKAAMGWTHACLVIGMKFTDEEASQMDRPMDSAQGLEAHALSDESTPDETQLSFPFDVPVGTHSAAKPCLGITRCTQPLRQGARTWFVEVSGCALAQGFVGPVVIVVVTPRIGASLLGFAIGQGLAGHLGLVA